MAACGCRQTGSVADSQQHILGCQGCQVHPDHEAVTGTDNDSDSNIIKLTCSVPLPCASALQEEFFQETVRKVQALYKYDCLRANKSTMAWCVC
jgi:hypothetical protein